MHNNASQTPSTNRTLNWLACGGLLLTCLGISTGLAYITYTWARNLPSGGLTVDSEEPLERAFSAVLQQGIRNQLLSGDPTTQLEALDRLRNMLAEDPNSPDWCLIFLSELESLRYAEDPRVSGSADQILETLFGPSIPEAGLGVDASPTDP